LPRPISLPEPLGAGYHKIGKTEKYIQSFSFYLFPDRVVGSNQLDALSIVT